MLSCSILLFTQDILPASIVDSRSMCIPLYGNTILCICAYVNITPLKIKIENNMYFVTLYRIIHHYTS